MEGKILETKIAQAKSFLLNIYNTIASILVVLVIAYCTYPLWISGMNFTFGLFPWQQFVTSEQTHAVINANGPFSVVNADDPSQKFDAKYDERISSLPYMIDTTLPAGTWYTQSLTAVSLINENKSFIARTEVSWRNAILIWLLAGVSLIVLFIIGEFLLSVLEKVLIRYLNKPTIL